VEYYQLQH